MHFPQYYVLGSMKVYFAIEYLSSSTASGASPASKVDHKSHPPQPSMCLYSVYRSEKIFIGIVNKINNTFLTK